MRFGVDKRRAVVFEDRTGGASEGFSGRGDNSSDLVFDRVTNIFAEPSDFAFENGGLRYSDS